MSRTATTAELADLILPFVGARLNPKRDPNSKYGRYLPETQAIDIQADCYWGRADVRAVTDEGVSVFFYSGCHLIPWDSIKAVKVVALDAFSDVTASTFYAHSRALVAA